MPRRLLFALLVLVAAPLALLGWLSASTYRQQQETARKRLGVIFQSRLAEFDRNLAYVFEDYSRDLNIAVDKSDNTVETLVKLDYENPIVRASFLVNDGGVLVYPPKPTADDPEQVALYASLPAIVGSKPDLTRASDDPPVKPPTSKGENGDSNGLLARTLATKRAAVKSFSSKSASTNPAPTLSSPKPSAPTKDSRSLDSPLPSGSGRWQVWYMDEGMQLIYWMPHREGAVGVLLERARWVSDLTNVLPDSTPYDSSYRRSVPGSGVPGSGVPGSGVPGSGIQGSGIQGTGFTTLMDESNRVVYRWGDEGKLVSPPLATHSLTAPLTNWQLEYHSADPLPGSPSTALFASLAGIGVVLLGLGVYVLTGVQRQMRAARNRVSFASQVSHELRTPLTNIRLYAELAESDLESLPASESRNSIERRLDVIDTESRRLGRLVSGVLEMIRDKGKQQGPRIAPAVPDEVIDQTLKQFAPSFQNADLAVERESGAGGVVGLDADILEMILVNLLSNVEKYAGDGDSVAVSSRMEGGQLIVRVADDGPGIAWRHRRSIFRPFARLDDSISAPSGTGIGLTIAQRLAIRHGGRLELVSSERGACFELRLPTQTASPDSGG